MIIINDLGSNLDEVNNNKQMSIDQNMVKFYLLQKYINQLTNSTREHKYGILYFYKFLAESKNILFVDIEDVLPYLTVEDFKNYIDYQGERHTQNKISLHTYHNYLRVVKSFLVYLHKNNLNKNHFQDIQYRKNINFTDEKIKSEQLPIIIQEFLEYLRNKNFVIESHKKRINYIFNFLIKNHSFHHTEEFILEQYYIDTFETFLMQRIQCKEIQKHTAYQLLTTLRHFIEFLNRSKLTTITYVVPVHFRASGNRSNEYVNQNELTTLIDTIMMSSRNRIRDLSIILILMETGCRPLEVANINLDDIKFTEKIVILRSKKSGQRKLKISKDLIDVIKRYIDIRPNKRPLDSSLFINNKGKPLSSVKITNLFCRFNHMAFGEVRITPKSLRHTFATNALDNGNNFYEVSKTMGHKHWVSTQYYLHRCKKRLLKNTAPYNPMTY